MQGLPVQQKALTSQGNVKSPGIVEGKSAVKADGVAHSSGAHVEAAKGEKGEFSSLFASMTGKEATKEAGKNPKKASQVKSETGETLKNLLADKNAEKSEAKVAVDPKLAQATLAASVAQQGQTKATEGSVKAATPKMEQAIAKTSNNLDQLLNSLKGTEDAEESSEAAGSKLNTLQNMRSIKNGEPVKGELKTETPLEFLVKGAKEKNLSENVQQSTTEAQTKKVVTGEDYLKNMQAAEKNTEKRPALAVINGQKDEMALPKMMNQNARAMYGQGSNLMNDSLIKNTKDLVNKDVKKPKSISGIDELQTKDTKVGAELASVRQEAIPAVQNGKDNHSQQDMKASANQKVLDLSHINTSNTTEIIKKISDYVEQNNVAGKQSLDLTVKHESLGEFKIQVSKMPESMNRGLNQIDMQITTSSKEGHDFFVKNEVSLMKNLNQAGVNLSDLRIVSSMSESTPFGQSDSRQSSSFSQGQDGSKQYMSFESNNFTSDGGSERRKQLWNEYQERYGA
jgi:hypothetical protein